MQLSVQHLVALAIGSCNRQLAAAVALRMAVSQTHHLLSHICFT
jgi:hypothetical protein